MSDLELGKQRAEELGLKYWRLLEMGSSLYLANDVHSLLGAAKFMSCEINDMGLIRALQPSKEECYVNATHKALLIGVKALREDTMEEVLKDLTKFLPRFHYDEDIQAIKNLIFRASLLVNK